MGREKKNAAQDVLNLYNQMQEEDTIMNGKEEANATIKEIEFAKYALTSAKTELANAYRTLESTRVALVAAHRSVNNIVDGIVHSISQAEQANIKVGINDEGLAGCVNRTVSRLLSFIFLPHQDDTILIVLA